MSNQSPGSNRHVIKMVKLKDFLKIFVVTYRFSDSNNLLVDALN